MTYKTKIDWWLMFLIAGMVALCGGGGTFLMVQRGLWVEGIAGIGVALGIMGLTLPTRYRLHPDRLEIRAGLFRWRIGLSSIRTVRYSTNPLGAPAWSLARLRIAYDKPNGKKTFVLISPRNREGFMRDLADASSALQFKGDRVIRTLEHSDPEPDEGVKP